MRKSACIIALCLLSALPLFAKDKEYRDATLVQLVTIGPDRAHLPSWVREDFSTKTHWWFRIHLEDLTYHAWCDMGKVIGSDWPDNTPVKIRFDVKGGAVATRTWIYLLDRDGKEIKLEVTGITDKNNHDYCGTFKCDPKAAEKKFHGE